MKKYITAVILFCLMTGIFLFFRAKADRNRFLAGA